MHVSEGVGAERKRCHVTALHMMLWRNEFRRDRCGEFGLAFVAGGCTRVRAKLAI